MDRDCIIALNIIKFWNFNVNLKNHINFLRQEIKSHIQLFNQTSFTSLLFVFTYFHLYVFLKCLYIFSSLCVPKYFVWIWKNHINFLWQKIKSHIQLFNQTTGCLYKFHPYGFKCHWALKDSTVIPQIFSVAF